MKQLNDIFSICGNVGTYVLSAIQQNEVLQIISFVLSSITSIVIIFLRLWSWWKDAKKDGKIEKEEIDEAIDIIEDSRKDKK